VHLTLSFSGSVPSKRHIFQSILGGDLWVGNRRGAPHFASTFLNLEKIFLVAVQVPRWLAIEILDVTHHSSSEGNSDMYRSLAAALFFVALSAATAQAQCDLRDPNCGPKVHPNADLKEARDAVDRENLNSLYQLTAPATDQGLDASLTSADVHVGSVHDSGSSPIAQPAACDLVSGTGCGVHPNTGTSAGSSNATVPASQTYNSGASQLKNHRPAT